MNFGVRLPGPFRVGVSSKGRVSAGVTMGPFSISSGIGGGVPRNGAFFPVTMTEFLQHAHAAGFRVEWTDGQSASVTRGWRAAVADVVPGGVQVRRVMSVWQVLATIAVIVVPLIACFVGLTS